MKKPVTKRPIEELTAGDGFRQSMLPKADHLDHSGYPVWHGWVIMDAFLAGIDYERAQRKPEPR